MPNSIDIQKMHIEAKTIETWNGSNTGDTTLYTEITQVTLIAIQMINITTRRKFMLLL